MELTTRVLCFFIVRRQLGTHSGAKENHMKKTTDKTLQQAIDDYIERGFGSMNKEDFEIFIFNEIINNPQYSEMSDAAISQLLRISESKVRELRFRAKVRFLPENEDLKESIIHCLRNARIVPNREDFIEITIEDDVAARYWNSFLDKQQDGGGGSKVLRLSADNFVFLMTHFYGREQIRRVTADLISRINAKKLALKSKRPTLQNVLKKIAKMIPSAIKTSLELSELVKNLIEIISSL